jgi:hypothetical protein
MTRRARASKATAGSKITAIDPITEGLTADEVLGVARGQLLEALADVFPAGDIDHAPELRPADGN